MDLVKEDGSFFNCKEVEHIEQFMADTFIEKHDKVLELGARYGSVSIVTNKKLDDKTDHVVVEPDETVWEALEQNKKTYDCHFQIVKGFLSERKMYLKYQDYSTHYTDNPTDKSVPSVSMSNFSDIKFNVLIADCEGGLGAFFDEYPYLYDGFTKVMMEEDGNIDYKPIKVNLMKRGFIKVFEHGDYNGLLHSVWLKVVNHPINYAVYSKIN